nr:hypothetical protein [Desulfogranum marinum]
MGLHAVAYRNVDSGKVAIVYEGTSSLLDVVTDVSQPFFWKPRQFSLAQEFAEEIGRRYCDKLQDCKADITLTGHSLGGGLAQYVALKFGMKAYVFNSAGLWGSTVEDVDTMFAAESEIIHFKSQGYKSNRKYGVDVVPYTGIQFPQTNIEIPIKLDWWYWDALSVELITHNMKKLHEAIIALSEALQIDKEQDTNFVKMVESKPNAGTIEIAELKANSSTGEILEPEMDDDPANKLSFKTNRFFSGNKILAKGSCTEPEQIGLFSSFGAIIFFPSSILFIEADDSQTSYPFTYDNVMSGMTVTCEKLPPQHYAMFGETIAMFQAFDKINTTCTVGSDKVCIQSMFDFADVTGDGQLTVAEITRIIRGLSYFVSNSLTASESAGQPVPYERVYTGITVIGFAGPMFAKNLVASVDFDGNGAASLDELLQDRGPHSLIGGAGALGATSYQVILQGIFEALSKSFGMLSFFL